MRYAKITMIGAAAALIAASGAYGAPLNVVNVNAPAVNCVFNTACTVTVTDTVANLPPAPGYSGTARLQSRTYVGAKPAPGAGKTAYVYRIDMTGAVAVADVNCVTWVKIDFGPVAKLQYDGAGPLDDVFVINAGGIGTIGLASADKVGNVITFTFSKSVCPAQGGAPGESSFFFGLAATTKPKATTAQAQLTFGGGIVKVKARAPSH